MNYDTTHLHELRLRLVECGRSLRYYRDNYEGIKAQAEQHAVDSGKSNGKNAEERARSMTLALQEDDSYIGALSLLRDAEYEHDRVEALLEAAKDGRRAAEWQIRAKLADGLFRQQVQSDADDPMGDSAFDDVADSRWTDDLPSGYHRLPSGAAQPTFDEWIRQQPPTDTDIPF